MCQDPSCPCCGDEREDWCLLFHCKHVQMTEAFSEAVGKAKSDMVSARIPSIIYDAYIALICEAAHRDHPDKNYSPRDSMEETVAAQNTLGRTAILCGFQHKIWLKSLKDAWIAPMPRADGSRPFKKDPIEQAACMQLATWDIFESIWNTRNTILHGEDSKLTEEIEE